MLENFFDRLHVQRRLRENPIGPVLEQFVDYLIARSYGRGAVYQYAFAVERFGQWLGRRKINRKAVDQFLSRKSRSRRCSTSRPQKGHTPRVALNRLLEMLGSDPARPPRESVTESLLSRYADHLIQVQGLAQVTVHYRSRYARAMLSNLGVRRLTQLKRWTVECVRQFVTAEARRCCPASGQVISSSIRSFLRFLLLHRFLNRDLAVAVPSFANWRLASLPNTVTVAELERLVRSIDTNSSIGLRDRAIVLCMVDLGLRASDVAGLQVDGVDLTAKVMRLRRLKQREASAVPMTRRLTAAIGAYLRGGRPPGPSSTLFLVHRAPRGIALTSRGIQNVIRRRADVAGLGHCIRGSHVIRHSAASRWINAGATLKQIADLLGHRSIDTTAIYAKVDVTALKNVALPWPALREVTR